jgi:hypothetical protein
MNVGFFEAQLDLYAILGVVPTADGREIRDAHRRLAFRFHPDRAKGDRRRAERQLKLINLAATILLHPHTRARYDELRGNAKQGRLRYPTSPHTRTSRSQPGDRARAAAYRARASRPQRWRTPSRVPPTFPLADGFLRRLVCAASLATLLVACVSERTRPDSFAARAARLRAHPPAPIAYAADYPPCPVRYATTKGCLEAR